MISLDANLIVEYVNNPTYINPLKRAMPQQQPQHQMPGMPQPQQMNYQYQASFPPLQGQVPLHPAQQQQPQNYY